jgi:threonine/homoserine/homoserine lactone efflux protein
MEGLLVAVTNPVAILFYIAFFPKFIDSGFSKPYLSFSALSATRLAIHLLYMLLLLLLGYLISSRLSIARWLQTHYHWVSALEILVGLVIIAYGCRLFLIG